MGSAARSSNFMELFISPVAWKFIAGESVTLNDFRGVDVLEVSRVEEFRAMSEHKFRSTYEGGELTFTVSAWGGTTVDLTPGGGSKFITWENLQEYCDLVEQYRLREMQTVGQAINRGLRTQLPPAMLCLMRGDELERRVCGNPNVDVDLLKSATDYSSYSEGDSVIVWFWEIMHEYSLEERKAYLRFVWGRSRLPLTRAGFSQRMKITRLDK